VRALLGVVPSQNLRSAANRLILEIDMSNTGEMVESVACGGAY
jgi:hypothetical protein